MSIYTRTGDKGKTRLYQGKTVSKASPRVEAYGSVDELNSAIGVAIIEVKSSKLKVQSLERELTAIQNDLFEIGASLSNPHSAGSGQARSKVHGLNSRVAQFEKIIDDLTKRLPELSNFVLPGGGRAGSLLHLTRTVCRRAERRIVELSQRERVDSSIIIYMNRLSDLLFMFARFINFKEKKKEILWKSR